MVGDRNQFPSVGAGNILKDIINSKRIPGKTRSHYFKPQEAVSLEVFMKYQCSGIILAGGLNSRLGGKNKAMLSVGGRLIIDRIYKVMKSIFDDLILVTNDPLNYLDRDFTIVSDIFNVRSSLTGIHAGLFYSSHPHSFVVACDTPFLQKDIITLLLNCLDQRFDVIIPETDWGLEPLCAIYSKRCLKPIKRKLDQGDFTIRNVFKDMRIKKIQENFLRSHDPELLSFFNINTPEKLEEAEKIWEKK
ncbi:molybdenum cofactor guanylyltransferase [Candidatus Magnetomoraceae bacterium gMMP-15]